MTAAFNRILSEQYSHVSISRAIIAPANAVIARVNAVEVLTTMQENRAAP